MAVAETVNIDMSEKRRGPRAELNATETFARRGGGEQRRSCSGRKGKRRVSA